MKNYKELAINEPMTKAWPENNFLNSIVSTKDTGIDWLMNTHIQTYGSIYFNKKFNFSNNRITFYPFGHLRANIYDLCPFIRKYTVPKKIIIENYGKLSKFIEYAINNELYVVTVINQLFITNVDNNYNHPCYFYGYDLSQKILYAVDNFDNGKYVKKQLNFDEVDEAFLNVDEDNWENSVILYELLDYKFSDNMEFIKDQLNDYLLSGNGMCYLNRYFCPSAKYENEEDKGEIFLGLYCYNLYDNMIDKIFEIEDKYSADIRSFAFLIDHKKMMDIRCQYLIHKKLIPEDNSLVRMNQEIVKDCELLMNLIIKYLMGENIKYFNKSKELIEKIKNLDVNIIMQLLANIK